MPTYEYECSKCRVIFDEFQSITAEPLKDCPHCKAKSSLKRLIGAGGGVIFKGSGFYETDYRSNSYKKGAKQDKSQGGPKSKASPEKGK